MAHYSITRTAMKIVLAFDSFKGCMSATEACHAAAETILNAKPDIQVLELHLSDGGEGLVYCIQRFKETKSIHIKVHGPLMESVDATYAISPDGQTAYMEMASACGLTLVPKHKRNPLIATTYGVGEMVADAIKRGCTTIIIGLGGSATCDGGRGMIEVLKVSRCLANDCKIIAVCDVKNPLYGANGAAHVFAPQKGASAKDVIILDKRLREFARETETKGFATAEMAFAEGAGAAGGLGYALLSYMKAELRPGIDFLLDIADFDNIIDNANLVITGEGKSDAQTMMGKVAHGVLQHCKAKGIPVWLISGNIDDKEDILKNNFDLVNCINIGDNRPLDILMRKDIAVGNLQKTIGKLLCERLGNEASGKDKATEIIYH